ncbi:MAG: hypothetical protein ACPG8W_11480 [Candidatus Promineifilaceae bacterium]
MSRHGKARRGPHGKRRRAQIDVSKPRKARRAQRVAKQAVRQATRPTQSRRGKPPSRRSRPAGRRGVVVGATSNAIGAEIARSAERVQRNYQRVQSSADLSSVFDAIGRIDEQLRDLPHTLDTLRDRGYVHGGDLDDRLTELDDEWDTVEPRIQQMLTDERNALNREIASAKFVVARAGNGGETGVNSAENRVDALENRVRNAQRNLQTLYSGIQKSLTTIKQQLHAADELLDWIDESADIELLPSEGPVTGAEAQWLRNGDDDGPTGILILTDQRLLFEQREKVVTRRLLGIFARESKMQQELLLDIDEADIDAVSADEKKGRFGFGTKEIIRLTGTGDADFSRLAFLFKDSEADDWVMLLKRVMNGDIDKDRDDEFIEEMEEAAEVAASFPTTCPNCLASLPEPQRGDTTIRCDFCGSTVKPT